MQKEVLMLCIKTWGLSWRSGWDSNPRYRCRYTWFRVRAVITTSIPLHIYLNTISSPAIEKPAQKKLRIWGDFVERTTKIFNYIIPQKTATYKGFRDGGYRIATRISSAAPSTTRTTLRVCDSAFLPKTFGKNWRKEQQNIQFSNRRKPLNLWAF